MPALFFLSCFKYLSLFKIHNRKGITDKAEDLPSVTPKLIY